MVLLSRVERSSDHTWQRTTADYTFTCTFFEALHSLPGPDGLEGLGDVGVVILYPVSLITHHQVRSRVTQGVLDG